MMKADTANHNADVAFNVSGLIALSRGLSDYVPLKLKPLETALDIGYFPKIMLYGGCTVLFIVFLGFWGAEMENRTALITYKILLCFVIGIELILLFYFTFNQDSILEQLMQRISVLREENEHKQSIDQRTVLENVESYLRCCDMNNPSKKDNLTKKAVSPACEMYPNVSCTKEAYRYFSGRTRISLWFLADIIVPQIASIIYADLVSKKILMLQNIMLGKLSSS